jgi:PhnB protein
MAHLIVPIPCLRDEGRYGNRVFTKADLQSGTQVNWRILMADDNQQYALVPELVVSNGPKALEWYREALGAEIGMQMIDPGGSGKVMHAEMRVNGAVVFVNDDFPEMDGSAPRTPEALSGSPVTIHLTIEAVDDAYSRAIQAGATATMPLEDTFWGSRYGRLRDPFGHEWSMGTPSPDMTGEELEEAMKSAG